MSNELNGAGADAPVPTGRIVVGGMEYVVERPSGRKASTAFKLLKRVSATVKAVTKDLGTWEREYARDHAIELDRVQARMRYPRLPILGSDGEPAIGPAKLADGEDNPRAGEPLLAESPLDSMSETDWEQAGGVVRLPMAPTKAERFGAAIDLALEDAEEELYAVLALFTLSNREVAEYRKTGTLHDRGKPGEDGYQPGELTKRADDLLDEGDLAELLELAVLCGEVVDDQFRRKVSFLGDRMGKALRLLGIDLTQEATPPASTPQTPAEEAQTTGSPEPPSSTPSSSSTPTSSSDSAASSDGAPTPPSTPTTPSSSPSATASTSPGP